MMMGLFPYYFLLAVIPNIIDDLSILARCKILVMVAGCIEEIYHFGFPCPNTGSLSLDLSEAFSSVILTAEMQFVSACYQYFHDNSEHVSLLLSHLPSLRVCTQTLGHSWLIEW